MSITSICKSTNVIPSSESLISMSPSAKALIASALLIGAIFSATLLARSTPEEAHKTPEEVINNRPKSLADRFIEHRKALGDNNTIELHYDKSGKEVIKNQVVINNIVYTIFKGFRESDEFKLI